MIRRLAGLLLITLLPIAVAGCSSQPLASSPLPGVSDTLTASEPASVPGASGVSAALSAKGGRAGTTGVVYVTSQGLYYDTFVVVDPLPMKGRFQLIENGQTEFGPGDPGYLGGRWWEDLNDNGVQDPDDHYFLCPLLPPGRPTL